MLPVAIQVNMASEGVEAKFDRATFAILGESAVALARESLGKQKTAMRRLREGRFSMREIAEGARHDLDQERIKAAIAKIDSLLDEMKIPRRLSQIGVKREQIPAIVRDSRGNSMSGNPRELSDEELTQILENML
jgi:alcohol dehydrogenase class IV